MPQPVIKALCLHCYLTSDKNARTAGIKGFSRLYAA